MASRQKMSREDRAKQFMPFAALKGYPEALHEKEKVIVPRAEIAEDYARELDSKLHRIHENDMITVTYFSGGEYVEMTGIVSRLDKSARILQVVSTKIFFDDIYKIESPFL